MKVLFALILLCYSQMSLAIGPLLEMKWQMPMQVRDVQEGEYDLPDYGMSSWYLYFPAPLFKIKDYRLVFDLTSQHSKMLFTDSFPMQSKFENRGYTALGLGVFPLKEEGSFQAFAFYRRFSGLLFQEGTGANEFNLGARINKSPLSYLTEAARYPMYFGVRVRLYSNFTRLLPYFIQYIEWGNSTLVLDIPTTVNYQYTFWSYHSVILGVLLDDTMVSPYSLSEEEKGWIANSFATNFFLGYTYFITSDFSAGARFAYRSEQVQYINDNGNVDFAYSTNYSPMLMLTLSYSP